MFLMKSWFKFQEKIPSRSWVRFQEEWSPSFPALSKEERLKDIGHIMSIGNLILGVNSVTVSYLIRYESLLQNATDIFTNATANLLQNMSKVYYKMRQVFYYKMRQLLQIAMFITNCDSTPCHSNNER